MDECCLYMFTSDVTSQLSHELHLSMKMEFTLQMPNIMLTIYGQRGLTVRFVNLRFEMLL